jgi:hypothetical protein
MTNDQIADRLDEVAQLLTAQEANPFRIRAWRNAAGFLRQLPVQAEEIFRSEGVEGLERLRSIGPALAGSIRDLLTLGRLPTLERLRGEADPERLLATIPGIGARTAERLHHDLGIGTLEELELAAHDGRLAGLSWLGPKRLAGVRAALATRLGGFRGALPVDSTRVSVEELLDVDREYRRRVNDGTLAMITPKRFNPDQKAWLPILHTQRGSRHYTALFSNTLLAHKLGRTHDWVVLYSDGHREERQATVITAWQGPLRGKRVVRGRELECEAWYARRQSGRALTSTDAEHHIPGWSPSRRRGDGSGRPSREAASGSNSRPTRRPAGRSGSARQSSPSESS